MSNRVIVPSEVHVLIMQEDWLLYISLMPCTIAVYKNEPIPIVEIYIVARISRKVPVTVCKDVFPWIRNIRTCGTKVSLRSIVTIISYRVITESIAPATSKEVNNSLIGSIAITLRVVKSCWSPIQASGSCF